MNPMGFATRSGGGLPETLPEASIQAVASNDTWRQAEVLAQAFLARINSTPGFSARFGPCLAALALHIETAGAKIARLG